MKTSDTKPQPDTIKILYIMGRGHSGSTVLDAILGNSAQVESVGELVSSITKPERKCSCGVLIKECSYWQKVKNSFEVSGLDWDSDLQDLVNQAHLKNIFKTILANPAAIWVKKLVQAQAVLFKAILDNSNKTVLVDSSKELTRAVFLLRFFKNAKVVHLIRNPEGTLASDMHRIKSGTGITILRKNIRSDKLEPLLMTFRAFAWLIGNGLAEFVSLAFPNRVLRIRYEDLSTDTKNTLERIAGFMDLDLDEVIESVISKEELSIGHNIGGNHMRLKGKFVFNPRAGSKRPLGQKYKLMATVICWPLMLAYGYKPFEFLNLRTTAVGSN